MNNDNDAVDPLNAFVPPINASSFFLTSCVLKRRFPDLFVDGHVEDGEGEHGDDAVGDHVDVDEIYLDIPTI